MKKLQVVMLALVAVFAFSAIATASASAEITLLAEWLVNGEKATELAAETAGLLNLSTLVLGINGVEVDCEGIFDGTVGLDGTGTITALLTSTGGAISSTPLVGTSLSCTVKLVVGSECTAVGTLVELWPHNLPWNTNLELMENGSLLTHLFVASATEPSLEPGYEVVCSNGKENLCVGLTSATVTNGAADAIGTFDATSEKATCTIGTGDLLGEGLTTLVGGGTLSASSE